MSLKALGSRFRTGSRYIAALVPGPLEFLNIRLAQIILRVAGMGMRLKNFWEKRDMLPEIIGEELFYIPFNFAVGRNVRKMLGYVSHIPAFYRGRSFMAVPHRNRLVVVYHHANKAGRHIDVHIGHVSMVYHVPFEIETKEGRLAKKSKEEILGFLRSQVLISKKVPQNLDHSRSNAVCSWSEGQGPRGYGSGPIREVILDEPAEVYKVGQNTIEYYCPAFEPKRNLYVHRLNGKILVHGVLKKEPPKLDEKLHLKLVEDKDPQKRFEIFKKKVGKGGIITRKYDGASCDLVITSEGTRVYSPRVSVETGQRIEYTGRLPQIANIRSDKRIIAKGELMIREGNRWLSANEIAGALNRHELFPKSWKPVVYIYRIQEGAKSTNEVCSLAPLLLKHPLRVAFRDVGKHPDWEGYVGIPKGGNIDEGFKVKYSMDPHDWRVDSVELKKGPKGHFAGVVWFTSLESGKKFKLGPGQIGNDEIVADIMKNPDNYVGRVAKVISRNGHEGRAARMLMWHPDK